MKTLLIIGIILFVGGLAYGATSKPKPEGIIDNSGPGMDAKVNIVSGSILTGFVLMILSGILYLRNQAN